MNTDCLTSENRNGKGRGRLACSGSCVWCIEQAVATRRHTRTSTLCAAACASTAGVAYHSLTHARWGGVRPLLCSACIVRRFEEELRTHLEGGVPDSIPHPHLQSMHPHSSPHSPSTAPKSHALLTTPLPMRKSLGDQVDWVVQELTSLK